MQLFLKKFKKSIALCNRLCYNKATKEVKIVCDRVKIGQRIKETRIENGFTQDTLGKLIGVNKSTIQRYENGKIDKIKLPVIQSIATALCVNPAWITFHSEEKYLTPVVQPSDDVDPDLFILYMYKQLDTEDKAEIRGEMKQMLKAEKYKPAATGDIADDIIKELKKEAQIPINSK